MCHWWVHDFLVQVQGVEGILCLSLALLAKDSFLVIHIKEGPYMTINAWFKE